MKLLIVFGIFCVLACGVLAAPKDHEADHENEHGAESDTCDFQEYKKKFGKHYDSQEEEDKAEAIFTKECEKIEKHNSASQTRSGGKGFQTTINQFTDVPQGEFLKKFTGLKKHRRNSTSTRAAGFQCAYNPAVANANIPPSYDARQLGLVNTPEHQGECGDCYAFSATGAMEGAFKKLKGQLPNFSKQQIASCSGNRPNYGGLNNGCHGGDQTVVYEYVNANGIEMQADYPYASMDGRLPGCMANPAKYKAKVLGCGWHQAPNGRLSVQDIQKLMLRYGVLAASMDASGPGFKGYQRGIYRGDRCGKTLNDTNHAVLFVGWGSENGQDFWIVKNSWGTKWGENGFFRIARGINECAMEVDVSYVSQI